MRTYTRKKPVCQVLENVQELCRLCLNKSNFVLPIFDNKTENQYTSLALRITVCVGIEVSREDGLPNIICKDCFQELQQFSTFRKKCEVSYMRLKSHIIAVKQNCAKEKDVLQPESSKVPKTENVDLNEDSDVNISLAFENDTVADSSMESKDAVLDKIDQKANEEKPDPTDAEFLRQSMDIKVHSDDKSSPDISAFLSMVLLELGILSHNHDDKLAVLDPNMRSLTLETADDEIDLALVEEDEEEENIQIYYEESLENEDNFLTDANVQSELLKLQVEENNTAEECNAGAEVKNDTAACCRVCGATLASRAALARHAARHRGLRPHACDLCAHRFAQRDDMLRHRLVHLAVRPFQCARCPKSYTQRAALRAHGRSHAPPAQRALAVHRCLLCPKIFLHPSGLSRHKMVHNGRVYMCSTCNRIFSDRSAMMRHLKLSGHAQSSDEINNIITCQVTSAEK